MSLVPIFLGVCIGMSYSPAFQVSPAPVRSPADAEKKRSLQRALDGLTPQLQEVVMEEGRQHDIRDSGWRASFGQLIYLCGPYVMVTSSFKDVFLGLQKLLPCHCILLPPFHLMHLI